MFDTKEEKANFKLENESQPSIHHFGDRYNRKPYVNIIPESKGHFKSKYSHLNHSSNVFFMLL